MTRQKLINALLIVGIIVVLIFIAFTMRDVYRAGRYSKRKMSVPMAVLTEWSIVPHGQE
jgi:DNA-binding transcriptional regulator GbsR (MarR family)